MSFQSGRTKRGSNPLHPFLKKSALPIELFVHFGGENTDLNQLVAIDVIGF